MSLTELTTDQWYSLGISVLILLATAVLGRWLIKILLERVLKRIIGSTKTTLDDVILDAIGPPLYGLALILALQYALARLDFISEALSTSLGHFYFLVYLLIALIISWRLVNKVGDWYQKRLAATTEIDLGEQLLPFLRRVAIILLTVLAGIIVLDRFDIEISGLVATLGIGSLAIALAAQAALADTISGFVIMIDRPYRIGDRIELLDLDTWGDVVDIGLRSTRIRTRDNRMVIVPNSLIGKSLIVNHSYPDTQYRIQIHLGVAYGTDIEKARQVIIEAVSGVEGVLPDRPVEALFLEFGDSSLIFRVRWWLESYVDTRRMFDRVNTAIYNGLNQAGVELPFPQRDLHHKIDSAEATRIIEVFKDKK